jgi:hypothetical protein
MDTSRNTQQLIMKRITGFVAVAMVVVLFTGCFYDKEELVYPRTTPVTCDTANMTFNTTILPLINARCTNCHTGTATSGFNFTNYQLLKSRATNGTLMTRLTTTDISKLMPQGGPKLTDCEIAKFRAWVNRGAPN